MSKFYVQCGPVQVVLNADSAAQAAMSAIDRSLQAHLWIYDDPGLSDSDRHDHLMLEALFHLDPAIRVSERGFDRSDCSLIGTPETIESWHHLMTGMNRLFVAAGLPPRAVSALASTVSEATSVRRPPR